MAKLDALKVLVDSGDTAAVFSFVLEFVADEIDRLDGNDDEISNDVKEMTKKLDEFITKDWANFQNGYNQMRGEMKAKAGMVAGAISLVTLVLANLRYIIALFGG